MDSLIGQDLRNSFGPPYPELEVMIIVGNGDDQRRAEVDHSRFKITCWPSMEGATSVCHASCGKTIQLHMDKYIGNHE